MDLLARGVRVKMDEITDTADLKASVARMGAGGLLAWYSTYTLQDWVAIVTIAYIILQIGLLIPKYWGLIFGKKPNDTNKK